MTRYDIILILEVVDVSGESVETLLDALNKSVSAFVIMFLMCEEQNPTRFCCVFLFRSDREHHYTLKISTRLGRTRYKEQFMFLYR